MLDFTDQPGQCPECDSDQLRLKGTHVAELEADFSGEDRIDYDFDNWHGWLGSIDCHCADCDHDWSAHPRKRDDDDAPSFLIYVKGGMVTDVEGLPGRWDYTIIDMDIREGEG